MTVKEYTSLSASGKLDFASLSGAEINALIDDLCSDVQSSSEEVEAKATPMPAPKIEELVEERVELDSKPLDSKPLDSKPMETPRIQDSEKKETPKPKKQDSEKKESEKKPKPPKAKKQDSEKPKAIKPKGEKKPLIRMKDLPKEKADKIRLDARVYRWIRAANKDYPPSKIPKDAEKNAAYAKEQLKKLNIAWEGALKKKSA